MGGVHVIALGEILGGYCHSVTPPPPPQVPKYYLPYAFKNNIMLSKTYSLDIN